MGITLDELRKKAQKQIKKKNYLGYFQKFNAGNVPLNNVIFNSIMDTSDSDAVGDISGVGEADGGIGMVGGAMGEDLEVKKVDTQEMPEEEIVTFHYTSKDENSNDKWYEVETSTVTVPKEDVIQALLNLLRYTEEFAYMDDSDFESTVRKYWKELKDEYYEELFNLFNQNMEDVAPENFTDEFYDDDVISFNYEDEEEPDAEFTSTEFEDIDSDDPTFESRYDPISKYDLEEDYYDVDFNALLDQAYNYGYNYGFEGEVAFQRLLNKLYEKYSLEDDEEERLKNAFYNGSHQAEMDEEEKYYNEEFHKAPYIPEYSEQNPENDYSDYDDEFLDKFAGYDPKLMEIKSKKHPFAWYENEKEDKFSYDDEPLQESFMSDLDLELQDPEYIKRLEKNIKALEDELDFLRNQAPKEIRKGGNFDSQEEIDDAVEQTERELAREQAKYKIIERAGLI